MNYTVKFVGWLYIYENEIGIVPIRHSMVGAAILIYRWMSPAMELYTIMWR
jgi:hypothetical protein